MKTIFRALKNSEHRRRAIVARLDNRAKSTAPAPEEAEEPSANFRFSPPALRRMPQFHPAFPTWVAWIFMKTAG